MSAAEPLLAELLAAWLPGAWLAGAAALLAWLVDRPLARRQRHGLRAVLWSLVLARLVLPADLGAPTGLAAALVPDGLDAWLTAATSEQPGHPRGAGAPPARRADRHDLGGATMPASSALDSTALLRRAEQLASTDAVTGATPRVLLPALALAAARLDPRRGGVSGGAPADDVVPATPAASTDGRASPAGAARPVLLLGLWGAGTAVLLAWALVASRRHRRRLLAAARPERPADWQALLARVSRRAGLPRPPTVLVSDAAPGPALVGLTAPLIVLPPEALTLDRRALELVLLHEACHLRRRDTAVAALTWLVAALWWWHPGAWLARRRLAGLRELACDAQVVACLDGRRADYGAALLAAADLARRGPSLPALAGAAGAGLSERVTALVAGPRPGRRGAALVLAAGLALLAGPEAGAGAPAPPAERGPPATEDELPADPVPPDLAALLQDDGCLIPHLAAAALAARASDAPVAPGWGAPPPATAPGPDHADDHADDPTSDPGGPPR